MTLTLTYRGQTTIPVELEGLTPDLVCDKTRADIERCEIFHGNQKVPLAELFSISGDAFDQCFEIHGDLAGVHWIGAHMKSGCIRIEGSVGRHLGSQMRGGVIHVNGNAADWTGAEMRNGLIHVHGQTGHQTGAAYRGSLRGMKGGFILVDGNAGNEVGLSMRRGLIAIGGSAGDMPGFNMIAGTIAVFGQCGVRPGAGMRRGTLALFGQNPPPLLPSFRFATTTRPLTTVLMLKLLKEKGFAFDQSLLNAEYALYHGDLISVGRGEILLRQQGSRSSASLAH